MILGIDEVGRGPWAGPLVVGAVVLGDAKIDGLTDSKKISKKMREKLDIEIREKVAGWGLGWVSAAEIDQIGLSASLELAAKRAVDEISTPYHEIIIDGTINFLKDTNKGKFVTTMPKADLLVPSVSAASIIAKVARDNYMADQDELYPNYGFKKHVGYGVSGHRNAIEKFGVTPLHRLSFKPLNKYQNVQQSVPVEPAQEKTSTKVIGDSAESVAANYLINHGHKIIARNWKNKYCEIDIVSKKYDTIYFNEVKYRKRDNQGGGLSAINNRKLNKMKFAANFYMHSNKISNSQPILTAISVSGLPPNVDNYLEIL